MKHVAVISITCSCVDGNI